MIELTEERYQELHEIERKYNYLIHQKKLTKNNRLLLHAIDQAIATDNIDHHRCITSTVRTELEKMKTCSVNMIQRIIRQGLPVLVSHKLIEIAPNGYMITKL